MAAALALAAVAVVTTLVWNAGWTWSNLERQITVTGTVRAVATAQLNGRPVVISGSGSGDDTVRVSDLATGQPVGAPFTGHTGIVSAVTTATERTTRGDLRQQRRHGAGMGSDRASAFLT